MNVGFLEEKGPSEIAEVAGVTRQTVTNWIKGRGCLSVDQAIRIARAYGVPLRAVIGYDDESETTYLKSIIAALDAENNMLTAKLKAIRTLTE